MSDRYPTDRLLSKAEAAALRTDVVKGTRRKIKRCSWCEQRIKHPTDHHSMCPAWDYIDGGEGGIFSFD